MTTVNGSALSAVIKSSFGDGGANDFGDIMSQLQADGKQLSMEQLMQIQIQVGVASLAINVASSFIKEFVDTAKGVSQKVG